MKWSRRRGLGRNGTGAFFNGVRTGGYKFSVIQGVKGAVYVFAGMADASVVVAYLTAMRAELAPQGLG